MLAPDTRDAQLLEDIGSFFADPLGYVMYAWAWGETEALRVVKLPEPWRSRYDSEYGPDTWQCEFLERLGELIRERGFDPSDPHTVAPVRMARRSGHGVGKGACVAMVASFLLDTRPGVRGVVTANTGAQLSTKTWPQIRRWKQTAITSHWWNIQATSIRHRGGEELGRLDALTWQKERSEAFAGQHAADSSSVYLIDEASAIDDRIWEVVHGGLTDGEPFLLAFGNPTRNIGAFSRCFGKDRQHWDIGEIDSRTSQITNQALIEEWIEFYGLHSDFVRVRVLGKEPQSGEKQLIPTDLVAQAMRVAELPYIANDEPVVMGVDVAMDPLGDEAVIFVRRGKDARSFGLRAFRGLRPLQLAGVVGDWFQELRRVSLAPSAIFVDAGGLGAGVVDPLRAAGYPVIPVNFGGQADRPDRFLRKDAEMLTRVKAWLEDGGVLPNDETLAQQLCGRPYYHSDKLQLFLHPKKNMKADLGLDSPDRADALALTFAFPVAPRRAQGLPQSLGGLRAKMAYIPGEW